MATEANKKPTAERWLPLESNPDVMNQFIWGLGIPESEVELHDVYGLDKELLEMVPQPVIAVLFLYPDSSQTVAGSKTEEEQILRIGMKVAIANLCYFLALVLRMIETTLSALKSVIHPFSCSSIFRDTRPSPFYQ